VEQVAQVDEVQEDAVEAVVAVDDYQLPAVARAASFCLTNLGWTLEELSPADDLHQWAALRTSTVPDTRAFDDYVEF
jgi:hypothetical protein